MSPKRHGSAETPPKEEGEPSKASGGLDSNATEPDPERPASAPGDGIPAEKRGPLTGRLIDGRYRILERVGEGGMGAVYRAVHKRMDKELAVKVLLPEYTAFEGLAKRFQQEAQSASRLDHPGIIQVFDFGQTEDDLLYLVMSFLQGRLLTEVIANEAPLSVARTVALGVQICEALGHAHAQGVVHRDLKPDNVMIVTRDDGTEQVKLLDFGIAKITQGEGAATGLTEAGAVFGTPEYLSPEQAAGDPVDQRTDLYSLGVILYEMLSGRKLFSADTNVKYLYAHIHDKPMPLGNIVPHLGISPQLDQAILRALSKNPEKRFRSAEELGQALARTCSQPVLAALPPGSRSASGPLPSAADPGGTPASTVPPGPYTLPAVAAPEAERKRKLVVWGLGAAVGALLALVVALSVILSDNGDSDKKGGAHRHRASLVELARIRKLMASKRLSRAEKQLNIIIQRAPKDPRVHLLFGHLHCRRGAPEACLASYNTAVVLDHKMRNDAKLLENLTRLLTRTKGKRWGRPVRERAVSFVSRSYKEGPLDPSAVRVLTAYVNRWWEHDLIWQVIELLRKRDAATGVDWTHAYEQRFRGVDSCDLRKKYIQEIVARKDVRMLPLLGKLYAERSLKMPYSKKRVHNACIAQDAAEAILALGGKLPERKPPPRRRSTSIKGRLRKLVRGLK